MILHFTKHILWMYVKLQKHKNYKTFKKNGYKNYELLSQVFNKSATTTLFLSCLYSNAFSSADKRQNEEEFLNRGVHMTKGKKSYIVSFKEKCFTNNYIPTCNHVKKGSNLENFNFCLDV